MKLPFRRAALAVLCLALAGAPADAQSLRDRLKNKVKAKVDDRTEQALDKAVNTADGAVVCLVTDSACIAEAEAEGKQVKHVDAEGNEVAAPGGAGEAGKGAWANYDFVPGERVLFADDLSRDRVGNFPQRLEFHTGTMEVVEMGGKRWLRSSSNAVFAVVLPETLPERFTMEFDFQLTDYANGALDVMLGVEELERMLGYGGSWSSAAQGAHLHVAHTTALFTAQGDRQLGGVIGAIDDEAPHRIRLHADGRYVKVYVDERRVVNVPAADLVRGDRIYFGLGVHPEYPVYIGDITVNAGGLTMYDALTAEGRVATQGIYFDTGSDRIRPESSGTLGEIAAMLKEHADLRLTIEGHTDNVGQADANQALSEKRAAAVKAALVSTYGIEDGRLETAGFGPSKPAAPNDTPEGRQQNRRVELVKL